jgi:hypothetical protein
MSTDEVLEPREDKTELGKDPKAIARRWKIELSLADKREKSWREKAKEIYKLYTPELPERNSFNILWPNTETLRQSLYNSLPLPQCKRRYSDEDPIGLKVGEVLNRSLEFSIDCSDFDKVCKDLVLSMLLPGRAVSWERYIPDIRSEEANSIGQGYEEIEWEQVVSEKVQYDDFRILCGAKSWEDVTAIGRRHTLNRESLIEKFGEEIGKAVKLDSPDLEEMNGSPESDLFKTAEVWEIWCKETKYVYFISKSHPVPLKMERDPLGLSGFFPTPRPLYAIQDDHSLVPSCLYTQYEQQAKELNKISQRINKLVDALRLRGVYDASLAEISQIMKSGDNDLIPSQNVTMLLERGGLEKAIWMMPIDQAALVLKELYVQRDAIKNIIYEITGISDIMRAASDPKETFGAQKIKTSWGTQRLQRMQQEVQRYIRDVLRIKAEIISKKFQMETLEQMTLVQLPHQMEVEQKKQQIMMQYQQAVMMAQQQGQQPPPPPQMPPDPITWEAVMQHIQDDTARAYHIDIETDSTLVSTQDADMAGLKETIGGMVELINGFGPAVQAGAIPIEAVKAIMGVVVRRSKMGSAVEEAIGKIVPPQPQANPEQIKAQAAQQQQQMQLQHEQQLEQLKVQMQMQIERAQMEADVVTEQVKAQSSMQLERARMEADTQIESYRTQMQAAAEQEKIKYQAMLDAAERDHAAALEAQKQELEMYKHMSKIDGDMQKAELDAATKITVAQIGAQSALDTAQVAAERAADREISKDLGD